MAQVIDYSISVPSNAKTQNEIVVGAVVFTDIAKLGLNVSLTPNRVRLIQGATGRTSHLHLNAGSRIWF